MKVSHQQFNDEAGALALIEARGYNSVVLDNPAGEAESHWHEFDSITCILSGKLVVTDVATGTVHECTAGSLIDLPEACLHAESTPGFRAAIGVSLPLGQISEPINKPAVSLPGAS